MPPEGTQVPGAQGHQRATEVVPVQLYIPCTRSDQGPSCQLLAHMEACNAVLWHLHLQLRDDEETDNVRLMALDCLPHEHDLQARPSTVAAIHLVQWLLENHRCLVYVELTCSVVRSVRLMQALIRNHDVKKVVINCCYAVMSTRGEIDDRVIQLIESFTQIESLLFRRCLEEFDTLHIRNIPPWWAATRIVSLDVADLVMTETVAEEFIAQLIQNNTVTSLCVPNCVFQAASFPIYLTKKQPTLKELALISDHETQTVILQSLVTVICHTTIEELTVVTGFYGTEDIDIFAQVVALNRTIRKLNLTWPKCSLEDRFGPYPRKLCGNQRQRVTSWLPALESNSVLKMLTIDFIDVDQTECHAFFRALMHNNTLLRVTILSLPSPCDLKALCATIRECGLTERVVIRNQFMNSSTLRDIADCPEVTVVFWDTVVGQYDFRCTLDILRSCKHITSVFLAIDASYMNEQVQNYLVAFIADAMKLEELWLRFSELFLREENLDHPIAISAVLKAIAMNTNLNAVTLIDFDVPNDDCELLVKTVVSRMCHVYVDCKGKTNPCFLRHLAPVIGSSHNLLHVHVPYCDEVKKEHFRVQAITRRNTTLLTRATDFVLGNQSRHCARALEFLPGHPKLVEMISDRAAVKTCEAMKMIKKALSSVADMNGFLRAAGVVKHKVECCARSDGQMQLDELNGDCWLHVRKYIKVADVQD